LLPFESGATFNPIILSRPTAKRIIGPIQGTHRISLEDDAGVAIGDYDAKPSRAKAGRRVAWQIAGTVAKRLSTLTLEQADSVLAANHAGLTAATHAGAASARIAPFGVDTERFRPTDTRNLHRGWTTFVVVAYLVARKRVGDIIEALVFVARRRNDIRLRIVGDGPERQRLVAPAQNLGVAAICEFVGRVPHDCVVEEYRKADVLVSALASETYGMSLLEAMACGFPVIAARNNGPIGIVEDGKTGYLWSVGEINQLALLMHIICDNSVVTGLIGMCALESINKEYAWKAVAENMLVYINPVLLENSIYADIKTSVSALHAA
jgi:glycosyltransferase involved in cell wall biosynthesis